MKWTTNSGEQIDIKDMSDNHLFNTINFIRRAISEWKQCPYEVEPDFVPEELYEMDGGVHDRGINVKDKIKELNQYLKSMTKEINLRIKTKK